MPFTNAPTTDTYSTKRLPLCQEPFPLYDNTYQTMWNTIPHKDKDGNLFVKSRYGIANGIAVGAVNGAGVVCRGLYVWEKSAGNTYIFVVVGTSIYTATSFSGPFTAVTTLLTNVTTPVRFTEFIDSTNTKSLVCVDGVEGYVFTSNAAGTKITDVDFPTPHVPFPVFLDGFLFLAKANTGDIYNSDLNNPAAWTAGSFISSEVYPDDIQALVKINNYILAIGAYGCEYFYDAANATGTPLARYEGQVVPFGTMMPNSIAYTNNTCCFIGRDSTGQYGLKIIEEFKYKDIPAPFLVQALNDNVSNSTAAAALRGYFCRQYGKMIYGLAKDGTVNSDTSNDNVFHYTLDFETSIWSSFGRGDSTARTLFGPTAYKRYPVYFTSLGSTTAPGTVVAGVAQNVAFIGILSGTSGYDTIPINSLSSSDYYYLTAVALEYKDFGTMNRKLMYRVGVDYTSLPEYSATNSDASLLPRVSWNDSPAQSTSSVTNYSNQRTVVASYATTAFGTNNYGLDFPFVTQLGSFRRRSLYVESYGGVIFNAVEADINKGQQ